MADRFRLHVTCGGQPLQFDGLDGSSVMLRGDLDVWPRETGLTIALPREEDQRHFADVKEEQGWDEIDMKLDLDGNDLVYRVTNGMWLPAARYQIQLTIAGLKSSAIVEVNINDGPGEAIQTLEFAADTRRVRLTRPVGGWDAAMRDLVTHPASTIDGRQAADWIADDGVPAQRRACLLNLLAKMRTIPSEAGPMIDRVSAILCVQLERVYARVAAELAAAPMLSDTDLFKCEGPPMDDIHQRLVAWVKTRMQPPEAPPTAFGLMSYREAVTDNSMQMVFAMAAAGPAHGAGGAPGAYVDFDIDLGGSLTDIVGFCCHMGELLEDGITDHIDLHTSLAGEPLTKDFLYYDVA